MLSFEHKGSFSKTTSFFKRMSQREQYNLLAEYGKYGVEALAAATPKDTGKTSESWDYKVSINSRSASITWTNSNVTSEGTPIAILIQYGHGTRSGAYIQGIDYINPVMQPIFEEISRRVWKEVTR